MKILLFFSELVQNKSPPIKKQRPSEYAIAHASSALVSHRLGCKTNE